jgi:hypothetical protein
MNTVVEKVSKGNVTVYRGGPFKDLVRAYSSDRMQRDPKYREDVYKAIAERRSRGKQKPATKKAA